MIYYKNETVHIIKCKSFFILEKMKRFIFIIKGGQGVR